MRYLLIGTLLCLVAQGGNQAAACNIPVFRYALERWRPDLCDFVLFHDGPLSETDQKHARQLTMQSTSGTGHANLQVIHADIRMQLPPELARLWAAIPDSEQTALPHVVVRAQLGRGRTINCWHGPLESLKTSHVLDSPARSQLAARLLKGESVVWLMLKSSDAKRTRQARQLMEAQLAIQSQQVKLPEGIGLPGSELHSDVPLLLKFTVLEIDPTDPREQFLVELIKAFRPEAYASGEPLLVPVFGRARALEVIPASELDAGLIGDLTVFLCGACSCQVKEQNPGFDLLVNQDWDQALFGDEAPPPPAVGTNPGKGNRPTLLTIPPGRKSRQGQP